MVFAIVAAFVQVSYFSVLCECVIKVIEATKALEPTSNSEIELIIVESTNLANADARVEHASR